MSIIKALILLVVVVFATGTAHSKCYEGGIRCWPKSRAIQQNAVFVLEGYGNSQEIIGGLKTSYTAHLQSGNKRVALVVAEILIGQFEVTQAVLTPSHKLEAGKQYELIIEGKGSKGSVISWQDAFRKGKMQYTVVAGTDETAPAWQTLPKESGKNYQEMGCGPEVSVAFTSIVHDQSEYLIKASVKDLANGKTTAYYLQPDAAGHVKIGHGMCGGPFRLEKGTRFLVAFSLMDASGNSTPQNGKAISFTRPEMQGK